MTLDIKGENMNREKNNTKHTLMHFHNFKLKLVIEGILIGLITGIVVVAYRLALDKASEALHYVIEFTKDDFLKMTAWFGMLILFGLIIKYIVGKEPMIRGSGIPQVKGFILRKFDMGWASILINKFIGGIIAIGAGLSLGREGPSIQIGAAIGKGFSDTFKRRKVEEKFLVTEGASAGLAAAFNAPLAGVIFSLEEVHKNFSPVVLISALAASVTADFVSKSFIGIEPVFDFTGLQPLPLRYYFAILILGIIMGLFGVLFNKSLLISLKYYKKRTLIPKRYKPYIPYILAGIFAYVLPEVLGGGHLLIEEMTHMTFPVLFLMILLLIKFCFTMVSYGSGAPGGIFLPLLVIGAIAGNIYGEVLHQLIGMDRIFINNMMILAMAGYFTAIVRAPITGCILISEMAGSFQHLLALTFISVVTYIIADLMHSKPIYDSLLGLLERNNRNDFKVNADTKVIIESSVCLGSESEGKMIKEIEWPEKCLLVGIKRGEIEKIPKGDTVLLTGDLIIALTDEDIASEIGAQLSQITEECKDNGENDSN